MLYNWLHNKLKLLFDAKLLQFAIIPDECCLAKVRYIIFNNQTWDKTCHFCIVNIPAGIVYVNYMVIAYIRFEPCI